MPFVEAVIALALLQFVYFILSVGAARKKYGVPAPAVSGNEIFERYFRVQMNTLEQLVLFVPAILLFAKYISPFAAAGLGVIYLIGRFLYFRAYVANPSSRSLGFGLTFIPTMIMLLGGLGCALYQAFTAY